MMVGHRSSICSAAGRNLSSSWARAIGFVAMPGMDVDDLDRTIAWLLTVPAAAKVVGRPPGQRGRTVMALEGPRLRWVQWLGRLTREETHAP